jgi:hypothetical protein
MKKEKSRSIHTPEHQTSRTNYLLTPCSRVLEKLTSKLCSWSRNSPHLWNPKIPQLIHKCPPPVPILSQLHLVPTTPSNFLKIHPNIIFPSTSWSPQWPLSLRLSNQLPVHNPILPIRATCPAHLIRLDFTTRTILGEGYRSFSSSLCSFLHSPVTSSLLGLNTFLNMLFLNILSLRSFLNVSDQVSHPYKTTGKIIVLYILIFKFLDSNVEDNRFCTE